MIIKENPGYLRLLQKGKKENGKLFVLKSNELTRIEHLYRHVGIQFQS